MSSDARATEQLTGGAAVALVDWHDGDRGLHASVRQDQDDAAEVPPGPPRRVHPEGLPPGRSQQTSPLPPFLS
jgi:hypothetical protein